MAPEFVNHSPASREKWARVPIVVETGANPGAWVLGMPAADRSSCRRLFSATRSSYSASRWLGRPECGAVVVRRGLGVGLGGPGLDSIPTRRGAGG
jgi:hypothetical protein